MPVRAIELGDNDLLVATDNSMSEQYRKAVGEDRTVLDQGLEIHPQLVFYFDSILRRK